ncbi:Carn_acyltransf domain-containing protein [Meloidogyne graminicola]|uniref:Carn_acyltransf domain-containing protein n=1 Tax=Meloidogyne graminicola TaxID=189291 RepID=A0A8S9ZW95_9BILA|nr:Carn_acyltransf domain-containing protein [Meloidogyne graminicola]
MEEITTIINNNNILININIQEKQKLKEEKNIEDKWKQYLLPKAPIPNLNHTLIRYLEYSSVLAQTYGLDLNKTIKYVKEFEENFGQKLQKKLEEIAIKEENWINQFWLKEMYLCQRLPLPINFNPAYIFPRCNFKNEEEQINYAALLIKGFLEFKEKIEKKQIPIETVPNRYINSQSIPMCMDQYERVLNFYRQPGINEDILIDRIILNSIQIAEQLNKIIKMAKNRNIKNIIPIGGSGTGERNKSAKFWEEMNKEKINQNSFEMICSSIFVLCLDDEINNNLNLNKLENDGIQILNGFGPYINGLNRWFDSTIQLIVSRNGCCGVCIEHSIAEGIVHINMTEEAIRYANNNFNIFKKNQKENLNNLNLIEPKPLSWLISEKAKELLDEQIIEFEQLTK